MRSFQPIIFYSFVQITRNQNKKLIRNPCIQKGGAGDRTFQLFHISGFASICSAFGMDESTVLKNLTFQFDIEAFHQPQINVLRAFYSGKHTYFSAPTGNVMIMYVMMDGCC